MLSIDFPTNAPLLVSGSAAFRVLLSFVFWYAYEDNVRTYREERFPQSLSSQRTRLFVA